MGIFIHFTSVSAQYAHRPTSTNGRFQDLYSKGKSTNNVKFTVFSQFYTRVRYLWKRNVSTFPDPFAYLKVDSEEFDPQWPRTERIRLDPRPEGLGPRRTPPVPRHLRSPLAKLKVRGTTGSGWDVRVHSKCKEPESKKEADISPHNNTGEDHTTTPTVLSYLCVRCEPCHDVGEGRIIRVQKGIT